MGARARMVSLSAFFLAIVYVFHFWNWPCETAIRMQVYVFSETPTTSHSPAYSPIFRLLLLFIAAGCGYYLFKRRHQIPLKTFYSAVIGLGLLPFFAEGLKFELLFISLAYCPLIIPCGTSEKLSRLVMFCVSSLICLLLVIYYAQVESPFEFVGAGGLQRLSGGFGSPLVVAPIALAGFIGGVHLLSHASIRFTYALAFTLSIISIYCLVAAATRSASIAAFAAAAIVFFKYRTPMTALITALTLSLFVLLLMERFNRNAAEHPGVLDASAESRVGYQVEATKMLFQNPLGSGRFAFAKHMMRQNHLGFGPVLDAKGYYINYGLEFGIGWMLFLVIRDLWLCVYAYQKGGYGFIFFNVATFVYKIIDCPFDFSIYILPASFAFAALAGVLIQYEQPTTRIERFSYE
jgi:hypothetical protein